MDRDDVPSDSEESGEDTKPLLGPEIKEPSGSRPESRNSNTHDGRQEIGDVWDFLEETQKVFEMSELLANKPCQNCSSTETSKVELGERKKKKRNDSDEELAVRYCHGCGNCFGADDSMGLEDLPSLFQENKIIVKAQTKCKCGNDDINLLEIQSIDEATGRPVIKCQLCSALMMFEMATCKDYEENNFSDSSSWEWEREARDLQEPQSTDLVCKGCGIREDNMFNKNYDDSSRLKSFICLNCYSENEVSGWNPHCHGFQATDMEKLQISSEREGCETSVDYRQCQKCCKFFDQSSALVCKKCGCEENNIFDRNYDENGKLKFFICHRCDCKNVVSISNAICPICQISDIEQAKTGSDNVAPGKRIKTSRRKVTSLDDVNIGDHVSWHRDYVIRHHAIVTAVKPCHETMSVQQSANGGSRKGEISVIHYSFGLKKYAGQFCSVRAEDKDIDLDKETLCVYDYEERLFYPADVVERAKSRLGEHRYNLVTRNCEHFARWCKTGEEYSNQVISFFRRIRKTGGTALSSVAVDGLAVGVCPGALEGLNQVKGLVAAGPLAGVIQGAIAFDVFLNLTLEAGLFAYGAHKAHQRCKSSEITKTEFHRELCQAGFECAGGFVGAVGGGFLCQLMIPIPFVGSLIGCTLGTLIGRFLGSIVGKKFSDNFFEKK